LESGRVKPVRLDATIVLQACFNPQLVFIPATGVALVDTATALLLPHARSATSVRRDILAPPKKLDPKHPALANVRRVKLGSTRQQGTRPVSVALLDVFSRKRVNTRATTVQQASSRTVLLLKTAKPVQLARVRRIKAARQRSLVM
jgi:hypothetical protein